MPPKTRKIPLTNQLEQPYSPDTYAAMQGSLMAIKGDPEAEKRFRDEQAARERYAAELGMRPEAVINPAESDVYINRIGNTDQNVLINRLGPQSALAAAPPPTDPTKKSMFARVTPLASAIMAMIGGIR